MMQVDILPENLPAWMRQPRHTFDWGIVLAAAFALLIAQPFITMQGVSDYNEMLHSGFMTADFADALGEGQIIPRWSPHALGGYGAPIPNFLPQGSALIAGLAVRLLTDDVATAIRLTAIFAIIWAAVAQYLFCRRWIGTGCGLLASMLYLYSPVLGLTVPYLKGDLAGLVGMALIPTVLWAASRLGDNLSNWDSLLVAFCLAALFYVYPALALFAALLTIPLTGMYNGQSLLRLLSALLGAIGLAAPIWLPALVELPFVRWRSVWMLPDVSLTLPDLIAPAQPVDGKLLNPAPQYTLGPLLAFTVLLGIAAQIKITHAWRFLLTFGISGLALAAIFVTTQESWSIYALTYCAASLGGAALAWRMRLPRTLRHTALPLALMAVIVTSSPVWLAPISPVRTDFSPLAQITFEQDGFGAALLPPSTGLPYTIQPELSPERALIDSYQAPILERIRRGTSIRNTPIMTGTHNSTWLISTTAANRISLLQAYFPGWEASLNGQPMVVERDIATGLAEVIVQPANNATLHIRLGSTPPRDLGWMMGLAALIMFGLIARRKSDNVIQPAYALSIRDVRLIGFALIFTASAFIGTLLGEHQLNLRPAPYSALAGTQWINAETDTILLQTYKLPATHLTSGDTLPLTLYWSAAAAPQVNYKSRIRLIDLDRRTASIVTSPRTPGDIPTRRWLPDYLVEDRYHIPLPDDLAAGTYQIGVEIFVCTLICDTANPIFFRDANGLTRTLVLLPTVITLNSDDLHRIE